jgi:predicted transposase YdaD
MTLTKKNPRIGKAVVILKELSADERTRMLAEDREKAWKDEQGRLDFALQKGRSEKSYDVAKKALSEGLSIELIQRLTSLKSEEIVALKTE